MPAFLIKQLIIKAITNPETTKKVILWLAGIIIALLILPALIFSAISSIMKSGVVVDENFDISATVVYQTAAQISGEVTGKINEEMEQVAKAIREEHTEEDEEGNITCTVTVTVETLTGIDLAYILAYLAVKDIDAFSDDYKPDKNQMEQFIRSLGQIQTIQNGDDYQIKYEILSLEEMKEQLFDTRAERELFETSYGIYTQFIAASQAKSNQGEIGGSDSEGESIGGGVSITQCHPTMIKKMNQLVAECAKKGLKIRITQTYRTVEQQDALYAQGRTKPGNIVTNAKGSSYSSMHQWGIAFDFCRNDGKGAYNDSDGFFRKVGQVGKSIGLEWGGDWKSFVDKPHFQLSDWGSSVSGLKRQFGNPQKFASTWRENE